MHYLKWLKLRRLTIPTIDENVEQLKRSYTVGWNIKWSSYFKEHSALSQTVKLSSTAFLILGIYPRETKVSIHIKT